MTQYTVPFVQQTGKDCWWYAIKMVKHFHKGLQEDDGKLLAKTITWAAKSPGTGLNPEDLQMMMMFHGFAEVPDSLLSSSKCSVGDFDNALRSLGPIVCIANTCLFGWTKGHVIALTGTMSPVAGDDEDSGRVVLCDPAGTPKIVWPLEYLQLLAELRDANNKQTVPRVQPFWYYDGKHNVKSQEYFANQ